MIAKMTNSLRFLSGVLLLTLLVTINACSDDDTNGPDDPTIERRTSGFIIVGTTGSDNALVKYVEELPTSSVDLSDGQDFGRFVPQAIQENAIFLSKPDGSNGFSKMVVNQDGELVEIGDIDISSNRVGTMAIRDARLGIYSDPNDAATLVVFNPATLEATGTIDLSAGSIPGNISRRYDRLLFRGDNIFAPVRGLNGESFSELIVHVADVSSNTFVGETEREANGSAPIRFLTISVGSTLNLTDDNGDFYFGDIGNNGRTAAGIGGAFARINRIPAGSTEIDDSYTFEPGLVLNPQNLILPSQDFFQIVANGRALAYVNTRIPNEALAIIAAAPDGNPANLEPDQITQLQLIIDQGVTYRWCELDLAAQSVTPIENIPEGTNGGGSQIFEHDGGFYLSIATTASTTFYRYDPATSTATEAFTVTGADLRGIRGGVFNLSNNF